MSIFLSGHRYFTNPKPLNHAPDNKEKEREGQGGKEGEGEGGHATDHHAQQESDLRTEVNRTICDLVT